MWHILIVATLISVAYGCLATFNPTPDTTTSTTTTTTTTTTTLVNCPCTLANNVMTLCPGYPAPVSMATFTVTLRSGNQPATDPPCTLVFSGCTQYRIAFQSGCQNNGNPGNPADGHGPIVCNAPGPNYVDSAGNVYLGVDCLT